MGPWIRRGPLMGGFKMEYVADFKPTGQKVILRSVSVANNGVIEVKGTTKEGEILHGAWWSFYLEPNKGFTAYLLALRSLPGWMPFFSRLMWTDRLELAARKRGQGPGAQRALTPRP